MTTQTNPLPPLPEADYWSTRDDDTPLYTADQMRSYAETAVREALAAQPRSEVDERAAFEAWADSEDLSTSTDEDGYISAKTQTAFDAWIARAALAQAGDLNLNCKSVQRRLATQWGYVPAQAGDVLTDEQIERTFQHHGGNWDGSVWIIEDADLHPFARDLSQQAVREALAARGREVVLPEGWVPLRVEYEPGYPEDVAFGPQIMMDRLKKWLDKFFTMRTAPHAGPDPYPPAQQEGSAK